MDRMKEVEELSQTIEDALLKLGIIMHEETNETFLQNYNITYRTNTPTLQMLLGSIVQNDRMKRLP